MAKGKKSSGIPHWGSDSDSEDGEDISNDNVSHDEFKSTSVVSRDTTPCSLTVVVVPENHRKDLTSPEVNQVEELKTFFVPPKTEIVGGKEITHRGILFYKSSNSSIEISKSQVTTGISDISFSEIRPPKYFREELLQLCKEIGCLKPVPRSKINVFRKLWDPSQRKIFALNGCVVNTRGLGFKEPDDQVYQLTSSKEYEPYCCFSTSDCDIEETSRKDPTILEIKNAPKELEEGGQSTIDKLVEINLGSNENPRPTYMSASLKEEEKSQTLVIVT